METTETTQTAAVQESRERLRLYVPTRASRPRPAVPSGPAASPESPWTADHAWRPGGQKPDYALYPDLRLTVRAAVLGAILLFNLVFLLPFGSVGAVAVLLDLAGLALLFDTLLKLWQSYRHGQPRARWITFPAFTGGRLEAVLVARPALEVAGSVRAVLRCVHDERVEREGEEASLEPVVIYRQIFEIPLSEDRLSRLPLSLEIPADLPGTDLGRDDAIYWQVAVRIPTLGPDLEAVYLAPVYARRG